METEDLPSIDPTIDYRKILPIQQKRTIAFINHFVTNTVSFLNNFAQTCESRLMEFEYKLQKVESSLMVLESQLSSIGDLDDIDAPPKETKDDSSSAYEDCDQTKSSSVDLEQENSNENLDSPDIAMEVEKTGPKACEDSRFMKFFKMVNVGVPIDGVKQKMRGEGIDPDILDKPNDVIPGFSLGSSDSNPSSSDSD